MIPAEGHEIDINQLADAANCGVTVVDVREPSEYVAGHVPGGYRAAIAGSFLAAAGRQLVAIDDAFDNAQKAGLPVAVANAA